MIMSSIGAGFSSVRRRPGLVFLLYAVSLALATLLAVPVLRIVDVGFGNSGFSQELAQRFDIVLWSDWIKEGRAGLLAAVRQFFWLIPLFIVIKVAAYVGLIQALKDGGQGSFWQGIGRYGLPGLGLALIYLPLGVFGVGALWLVLSTLLSDLGEVGTFWLGLVIGPLVTVAFLAVLDLMHDFARIWLVTRDAGVWQSFGKGSFWPLRRLSAIFLYLFWFLVASILWLLPFWFDLEFGKTTVLGMLGAFATQQVVILVRQAASVGWVGSEVAYFQERFIPESEPEPESESESESEPGLAEKPVHHHPEEGDPSRPTSEESPNGPH